MTNAKAHRPPPEETQDRGDRPLLERFVARRDEEAFTELVRRHGGTVWSVCRRVLAREQDAEDAFQATFLVLARKAAMIRKGEAVGSWLYAVAYRAAMRARHERARQQESASQASPPAAAPTPVSEATFRELQRLLDEEMQRLPEKYRAPFILCCLQGLTRTEAARELGCKEGTVSGNIARARALLQKRLTRHGIALSAALATAALAPGTAAAAPPVLAASTAQATLAALAGKAATLSPSAVALAEGVIHGMATLKFSVGLAFFLTLALGVVGALATLEREPAALPAPLPLREAHTFRQPPQPLLNPVDGRVLTVAVSPDGRRLATAGAHVPLPGHLTLWDLASQKPLAKFHTTFGIRTVAFAPASQTLATGDFQGMLRLRDAETGAELAAAKAHEIGVNGVAFAPDGRTLVTAGLDKLVKLWDARTLQPLGTFTGHADWVLSVAFFGSGRSFVTGSRDGTARIWDVQGGPPRATLQTGQAMVEVVAVAPDERTIATGSWNGTIKLWDADKGTEQAALTLPGSSVLSVAFAPDGKRLAAAGNDGAITLWDLPTRALQSTWKSHADRVWSLAFFRDGKTLASGGDDGTARLWDVEAGKVRATLVAGTPPPAIAALAYAPAGQAFAVARGAAVELCDAKTGAVLQQLTGQRAAVTCLAFAPDWHTLAGGSSDGSILLWDVRTGEVQQMLEGQAGAILGLCFAPDGRALASGGTDGIELWDPATGRKTGRIASGGSEALAFSPDGRSVAGSGEDGLIKIWDTATGKEQASLRGHRGMVRALAFAPDGTLASGGDDTTIRLWQPTRGATATRILRGHSAQVSGLLFSPGGHTLVSRSQDGSLFVWDPAAGVARQNLGYDLNLTTALAFHPQGDKLLNARGGAVLRWEGLPPPPGPPTEVLPERLYQDFRNGGVPVPPLALYYRGTRLDDRPQRLEVDQGAGVARPEAEGLHITLVPDQDKHSVWAQPALTVSGDFDISARYEILALEPPRLGFGVGVGLVVSSRGAATMAKLYRLMRPSEGACYLADLTGGKQSKQTGRRIDTRMVPSQTRTVQLRLVREGETLRYLVAEEPGQEFREIYRADFGARPVEDVKFMVTSHESNARIDARLLEVRMRMGRFSSTEVPQADRPPAELLPEQFYQDLRGARTPLPPLVVWGPDVEMVTTPEAQGLRINLPANRPKQGISVQPKVRVSGDFDITAGYELLHVEPPRQGAGAGVVLLASSPAAGKMAKLCRLLRVGQGEQYLADITDSAQKPPKITTHLEPTQARAGQLRLIREGALLRYFVAEAPGQEFREIHRAEFGTRDVESIRVVVTPHESTTALDARITDVRIRSGTFKATTPPVPAAARPADPAPAPIVALPSPAPEPGEIPRPPPGGRRWLALAMVLFLLLGLAGLGGGIIWARHRSAQTKAPQAATTRRWVGTVAPILLLLLGGGLLVAVFAPGPTAFLNVPLGSAPIAGVEESGFYDQEFDSLQRPFRWTDGTARLIIPLGRAKLPRAVLVQLHPSRPATAPAATLRLVANEQVLFQGEIPAGVFEKTFDLDPAMLGDRLTFDIQSNTFVPQALPGSTSGDCRPLGVQVSSVRLLGPTD